MRQLWDEVKWFLNQKIYVLAVAVTILCGYGFEIVHPSIGIDDTATELYFEDGLAVVMGRWTLFLINKIFHIAEFSPFMLELIGVLFLACGAALFAVLFKRCLNGIEISIIGYTIFTCFFVGNSIHSEGFIYYCHNGIGIGYIFTALALLSFERFAVDRRNKIGNCLVSLVLICMAAGCYESFIIVYIIGIIIIIFSYGIIHSDKLRMRFVIENLLLGAVLTAGCMILREIVIHTLIKAFHLQNVVGLMEQRALSEMMVLFRGKEGWDTFIMLIKRYWLVYCVNAICYSPVAGYVAASCCLGIIAVGFAVMRKNIWYVILWMGMLIAPFLLTIVQASLALYRSCQYIPFFTAYAALMVYCLLKKKRRYLRLIMAIFCIVAIFNQTTELNHNFYIDYQKYEHTKNVLLQVAYEVEKEYGVEKAIIFTGHYDTPYEFIKDYYVGYGSWQYQWIVKITDKLDPHLKEKYFSPYGYSFIGEAYYPFIQWGLDAFDGTNGQMIRFLEMHGHSFYTVTDQAVLEKARIQSENLPEWPLEGSIVEQDNYILIHM